MRNRWVHRTAAGAAGLSLAAVPMGLASTAGGASLESTTTTTSPPESISAINGEGQPVAVGASLGQATPEDGGCNAANPILVGTNSPIPAGEVADFVLKLDAQCNVILSSAQLVPAESESTSSNGVINPSTPADGTSTSAPGVAATPSMNETRAIIGTHRKAEKPVTRKAIRLDDIADCYDITGWTKTSDLSSGTTGTEVREAATWFNKCTGAQQVVQNTNVSDSYCYNDPLIGGDILAGSCTYTKTEPSQIENVGYFNGSCFCTTTGGGIADSTDWGLYAKFFATPATGFRAVGGASGRLPNGDTIDVQSASSTYPNPV